VHTRGARLGPTSCERHGIVGTLDDIVIVPTAEPHRLDAEDVDGGDHLDRARKPFHCATMLAC
jgi:hypothetical protein